MSFVLRIDDDVGKKICIRSREQIGQVIRGKYFVSEKLKIGNQVDFKPLDAMSKKERNLMEKLEIWKRNDLPKILISHSYFKT